MTDDMIERVANPMTTLSPEQQQKIADYLKGRHIPMGLGTKEEACSIAAINLALTGELTDAPERKPDGLVHIVGAQHAVPDLQ